MSFLTLDTRDILLYAQVEARKTHLLFREVIFPHLITTVIEYIITRKWKGSFTPLQFWGHANECGSGLCTDVQISSIYIRNADWFPERFLTSITKIPWFFRSQKYIGFQITEIKISRSKNFLFDFSLTKSVIARHLSASLTKSDFIWDAIKSALAFTIKLIRKSATRVSVYIFTRKTLSQERNHLYLAVIREPDLHGCNYARSTK